MSVSPATDQSSTTDLTIEQRMARTVEIHAELLRLWGADRPYLVTIAVFPPIGVFSAIPAEAQVHPRRSDIVTKTLIVTGENDAAFEPITFHRPTTGGAS